jgi:hypothetical protein
MKFDSTLSYEWEGEEGQHGRARNNQKIVQKLIIQRQRR